MNCEKVLNLIDGFIEDGLDERTAAQVDSHVLGCRSCREQSEIWRREKEIYAHYLFGAEPPVNLWTNFQTRLELEKSRTLVNAKTPAQEDTRRSSLFGFLRFAPVLAAAALLIGISLFSLMLDRSDAFIDNHVAETQSDSSRPPATSAEDEKSGMADSPMKIKSGEDNYAPHNEKSSSEFRTSKLQDLSVTDKESNASKAVKTKRKLVAADPGKTSPIQQRLSEYERLQRSKTRYLEIEIAGQIEKVEMLLRSFRNAREVETIETFDVGYEKEQARKLLGKNVRLRRGAESYGIIYGEELLGRVEPYLLDIANLENNPAPDKVLDIKKRVKNQSIIASLQIY